MAEAWKPMLTWHCPVCAVEWRCTEETGSSCWWCDRPAVRGTYHDSITSYVMTSGVMVPVPVED